MKMLPPLPPDPYKALGVDKRTQPPDIKKAHRALVLKCHPDKIQSDDPELRAKKVAEFQAIQQAYELLMDEKRRGEYDDLVEKHRRQPPAMPNMSIPRTVPVYTMRVPPEQVRHHIYTAAQRPPVFNDGKPTPRDDYVFVDEAGIRRGAPRKERKTKEEWDEEARRERDWDRVRDRGSSDHKKKREDKERERKHEEKKHRQKTPDVVPQESYADDSHGRKSSARKHDERHKERDRDRDRDRGRDRSRRDRTPADEDKSKIQVELLRGYLQSQGSRVPEVSASRPAPRPTSTPRVVPIPSFKPALGASPPHAPTPPPPMTGLRRPTAPPTGPPPAPHVEELPDEDDVYRSRGTSRRGSGMAARSAERLGHKKSYSGPREETAFPGSSPRATRPIFANSPTMPAAPDLPPNPPVPQMRRAHTSYHPDVLSHTMGVPRPIRRSGTMDHMAGERDHRSRHIPSYATELHIVDGEEEDEKVARRRAHKEKSSHRSSRRAPSPSAIYDDHPQYRTKTSRSKMYYEVPPDGSSVRSVHPAAFFDKLNIRRNFEDSDVNWARYPGDSVPAYS